MVKNKLILLLIFTISFLELNTLSGCKRRTTAPSEDLPVEFSTYENPNIKIKIDYPAEWTKEEMQNTTTVVKFSGASPSKTLLTVELLVEDLSNITIEEYNRKKRELIDDEFLKFFYDSKYSDTATLANRPAYSITSASLVFGMMNVSIWTFNNKKVYSFIYSSDIYSHHIYYPKYINEMINSFEILN